MINRSKATITKSEAFKTKSQTTGRLLITDADEIIYANAQARHFLGLLSEDPLPSGQKFLPLLRQTYQVFPVMAWLNWPKRPSRMRERYLVYRNPSNTTKTACSLLKVEIVEQILLDDKNIWVILLHLVESQEETTKIYPYV